MLNTFISYDGLPFSAGGAHALNSISIRKIYQKTIDFLNEYGNTTKPKSLQLTFAWGSLTKQSVYYWLLLTKNFGLPAWEFWHPERTWNWQIDINKREQAMQFVERLKMDNSKSATLILTLYWHFQLVDPRTGVALSRQDEIPQIDFRIENSRFYLRLGAKSTIAAWLAFPFDFESEPHEGYLRNLCSKLPFKVSNKHWRVWTRKKSGNWIAKVVEPDYQCYSKSLKTDKFYLSDFCTFK